MHTYVGVPQVDDNLNAADATAYSCPGRLSSLTPSWDTKDFKVHPLRHLAPGL